MANTLNTLTTYIVCEHKQPHPLPNIITKIITRYINLNDFSRAFNTLQQHALSHAKETWWPIFDEKYKEIEVMVGAVLTQNTAWTNVERALHQLHTHNFLNNDITTLWKTHEQRVKTLIKPAGFINQKYEYVMNVLEWWEQHRHLINKSTAELRKSLLEVRGVGRETADTILCFAFHKPVFIVDAYFRRVLCHHSPPNTHTHYNTTPYDVLRVAAEWHIAQTTEHKHCPHIMTQLHAGIVEYGKTLRRKR